MSDKVLKVEGVGVDFKQAKTLEEQELARLSDLLNVGKKDVSVVQDNG